MKIDGSSAIVFGGASGLGEATACTLAAEGAKVTVADLAVDRAQVVASAVDGVAVLCDVTKADDVTAAVAAAGNPRIGVICAGVATPAKLVGRDGVTPLDTFARVIEVNLLGTINALRVLAASMSDNEANADGERGVCVMTASVAAFDGQIGQIAYAASKGGIASLTLPAACELAGKGVRVMAIAPGLFATPLLAGLPQAARDSLGASVPFPARLGDPAEYADLVRHIVTHPMLNGAMIRLDGALRMAAR